MIDFNSFVFLFLLLIPCVYGIADYERRNVERELFGRPLGVFNAKRCDGIE